MIQQYKQFVYCGNQNSNYNTAVSRTELENNVLANISNRIVQLAVQAPPGTRFYINGAGDTSPVMVGYTGYLEIDLSATKGVITSLKFNSSDLDFISNNDSAILIIDVAYLVPEVGD